MIRFFKGVLSSWITFIEYSQLHCTAVCAASGQRSSRVDLFPALFPEVGQIRFFAAEVTALLDALQPESKVKHSRLHTWIFRHTADVLSDWRTTQTNL